MRRALILVAAAALVATPAMAEEKPGFYVGFDVGKSLWNVSQSSADNFTYALVSGINALTSVTATPTSTSLKDHTTTWSFFVGCQIVPGIAVEATWMQLGYARVKSRGTYTYRQANPLPPSGPHYPLGGTYSAEPKFESQGGAVSVLPMRAITDAFTIYGRLGVYFGDNKLSGGITATDSTPPTPAATYSGNKSETARSSIFLWGLGASYTFEPISLRLEYDGLKNVAEANGPYGNNKTSDGRLTVSALYRF